MKKVYASLMVFFLLFVIPGVVYSQSAKEAVKALKKLESRIEVGISYRDYSPALGDVQFEVKMFLESPEAKAKPELAKSVSKVRDHYVMAKEAWDWKFIYPGLAGEIIHINGGDPRNGFITEIIKSYPDISKAIGKSGDDQVLLVDDVVRTIWAAASKELKRTSSFLSKSK